MFYWPESEQDVVEVSLKFLAWLLQGLDEQQAHSHLSYVAVSSLRNYSY